jgi:hypothetical protein
VNVADTLRYVEPTDKHKEKFDKSEGTYITAEVQLLDGGKWSNAHHGPFIPAK